MKKTADGVFLLCLLAVLLAVPAGTALWSHRETSAYYENRTLAELPALTMESLWDGSFGSALETWYSDHAPGRTTLLKLDTAMQMKVLKRPVVNGIVLDAGEVLVPYLSFDEWSREAYESAVTAIADGFGKLNGHIGDNGGVFLYAGFPEQRIYFEDAFPAYLNNHAAEAATADAVFAKALGDRGVDFVDMRQVYEDLGHPASYYAAVDHHYNYYGAYAAYRAIMEELAARGLDLPVLTEDKLDFVELPNPYIGSRNRKLYNLWPNSDRAVIGVQKNPVAFTRTDNGAPSEKPLFVTREDPAMPVTYDLYMGGDFGETVLETGRPELPDLLIFGDSFTNALETLLYASFDTTRILDLRHYTDMALRDYITTHQPDVVLSIQNDTFYYTAAGNGAVWPAE